MKNYKISQKYKPIKYIKKYNLTIPYNNKIITTFAIKIIFF